MARRRKPHKRIGSSKAGRPKKEGARYPSGKLKPQGPNETVLERRKIGDASAGEHPLDFALSRQWLTEREHKDAMAYRAAYNRAHAGGDGPKLALSKQAEVDLSEALRKNWSELPSAEITRIFDQVFSGALVIADADKRQAEAAERWKRLNLELGAHERSELFKVCVLGSWPFWMPKLAAGRALGSDDLTKQAVLFSGLEKIARVFRPQRKTPDAAIVPLPTQPKGRAERSEEPVNYVTEEGERVWAVSEHGVAFEVSILRKRA